MKINEQILQKLSDPCFDNLFPIEMKKALEDRNGEGYSEAINQLSAQLTLLLKEEVHQDNDYVKTQPPLTHKPTLAKTAISLKKKHISYKQQLLIGIGEADEYKLLCKQYPELKEDLQPKYNNIRDQNTKILGKIKVIESLLNNKSTL
jgi:hypothetical protein